MTLLHHACDTGNRELVQIFLDYPYRADFFPVSSSSSSSQNLTSFNILFARNLEDESPLSLAILCDHLEIVQLLIDHALDTLVTVQKNGCQHNKEKEQEKDFMDKEGGERAF